MVVGRRWSAPLEVMNMATIRPADMAEALNRSTQSHPWTEIAPTECGGVWWNVRESADESAHHVGPDTVGMVIVVAAYDFPVSAPLLWRVRLVDSSGRRYGRGVYASSLDDIACDVSELWHHVYGSCRTDSVPCGCPASGRRVMS